MKGATFRKISEEKGNGTFSFDNFEKEASFKIEFYIGKEALIFMEESFFSEFSAKLSNMHNQKQIKTSLSGIMNNGSKIHIDKIILINAAGLKKGKSTPIKFKVFSPIVISNESLKPIKGKTEIHYYITNFEFNGCEKIIYPKGEWKLDHFSVSFEGYTFNIKQIEKYCSIPK